MYRQDKEQGLNRMIEKQMTCLALDQLPSDPEVLRSSTPRIIVWRLVNGFMTCFFLFAAVVQINDPDPYLWIPIYFIPALLSGAIVWRPTASETILWRVVCLAHLIICLGGAIYLTVVVFHLSKHESSSPLQTEEGRELAGLLIIECWLAIGMGAAHLSNSSNPRRCIATVFLMLSCIVGITPLLCWSMCFVSSLSAWSHCVAMETAPDNRSSSNAIINVR